MKHTIHFWDVTGGDRKITEFISENSAVPLPKIGEIFRIDATFYRVHDILNTYTSKGELHSSVTITKKKDKKKEWEF